MPTTMTKARTPAVWRILAVPLLYRRHCRRVHGDHLQADRRGHGEGRPSVQGRAVFRPDADPKAPRVIEYNARFGDPETQAVLSRLDTDLFDIFNAVIDEKLEDIDIKWADNAACCVCMASGGYPKAYEKGKEITGLDDVTDSFVFHAGTAVKDGKLVTNGGRVLGVTATAPTLDEAIQKAYADVKKIHFDKAHYRHRYRRKVIFYVYCRAG